MDDLCTACLCAGRKLSFIGETGSYHLYSQILNEIPVYEFSICVKVCWECRERLRRFGEFKVLVKTSYTQLLQHLNQIPPPPAQSLARPPRLKAQNLADYGLPEPFVIKEELPTLPVDVDLFDGEDVELKPLKEEHDHSEPDAEAFVEDLEVDAEVKKSRRKKFSKKGEEFKDTPQSDFEELAPDLEFKKVKKKRTPKKTSKVKSKKKLKSKSKKLEEKKINTKKKAEDSNSVCSEDCKEYVCGANSDGGVDDADDIDDDMVLERVREKKDREVTRNKKTETKGDRLNDKTNEEILADSEYAEIPQPPAKPIGIILKVLRKGEDAEPEMQGGKPKCAECGKIFSSKKTYRYHLNVLHKGQNRYPCPRCGKVYQWKSNLGRHMRTHKARDSGELYCETCDKRFASVATFRQHLRVSRRHVPESEFNFECHECGKKFVSKTRLRDHVDWEHLHNIKFRCQICNKPFKCHTSLYVHMQNVHHNKKKENLCHICGKSYQNPAKLKYHIVAMHTSETPYRCAQCAAAFGWYSSLYRHVREVHYKMKLQPKKMRKTKRPNEPLPLPPHNLGPPHPLPTHM